MSDGDFWAKYKDPRWQKMRLEVMERSGFACDACGCDDKTLNVHHMYYERGKDPWDYPIEHLATLCDACHKNRHEDKVLLEMLVADRYSGNYGMAWQDLKVFEAVMRMQDDEPLSEAMANNARDELMCILRTVMKRAFS